MRLYLENLTKEYEKKCVLTIDKLLLEKGFLYGIIGPNGAGKSTLLNIIAGLMKPSGGKVLYDSDLLETPPFKDMTMVFQSPYLMYTTVEKNISYPLKLRGWSYEAIEERVCELTEELGLETLRKKKCWKLSGGETQKVALARALSFHPRLLLLDEPTANVDPATTGDIERMLKKINEAEGTTVITITHNLVQARRLCNRILFMDQGKIIEYDSSEKILREPQYELTKRFVSGELLT